MRQITEKSDDFKLHIFFLDIFRIFRNAILSKICFCIIIKGGNLMKLEKRNIVVKNTVLAYACKCSCACSCVYIASATSRSNDSYREYKAISTNA